ncbi:MULTISPECIES: class II aldolase/adducin family protein [unclassified Sporosarcina]|uniref:class II aldolase/adducin family protein n=1 Tax=unclassified Sporosarcina TaxID=2647733 RepID=UPI000C16DB02|nr:MULTISPECIES: class II aldolase/adducin family protein [unclassified Sporosarcina]PID04647.1 class II aldolase/adducin family protein [Sporosarcina sp. P30]PID07827.1 class II aldolase/adducin family protein [Sporosarcina sp. P31]PID10987.1 class II aldolase/adducin family protein [Sporosarcina sp. P32b]
MEVRDIMKAEFTFPTPPEFATYEEERTHIKERLAGAFRLFSRFGFDNGIAGHMTVRDPEHSELFWVNPFGKHFSQMKVSDLVLANFKGEIIEGKKDSVVNAAGLAIHSQIHEALPHVNAVTHAHSTFGTTWSALGRSLDPISQDSCVFFNRHGLYEEFNGVVLDYSEGKKLGELLENQKALILQNHGLLTVGQTIDEAAWWFITMEKCCQQQLMAEAVGTPKIISDEVAEDTAQELGTSLAGWFSFQPLWERITNEQPEFLEK